MEESGKGKQEGVKEGKGYDQGKCKEKPCTLCHEGWSLS